MTKIGFDLDGVLADQTKLKVEKFRELFGIELERWQVSSNVIDEYIPDKAVRRVVGSISGTAPHTEFVEPRTPEYLRTLVKLGHELYLVSRRGKSKEGVDAGYKTIDNLHLKEFFGENIEFCETDLQKVEIISKLGCSAYIDDRAEVVNLLKESRILPILYDPFELVAARYVKLDGGIAIASLGLLKEMIGGAKNGRGGQELP